MCYLLNDFYIFIVMRISRMFNKKLKNMRYDKIFGQIKLIPKTLLHQCNSTIDRLSYLSVSDVMTSVDQALSLCVSDKSRIFGTSCIASANCNGCRDSPASKVSLSEAKTSVLQVSEIIEIVSSP